MILVDPREGSGRGKGDLYPYIKNIVGATVPVEKKTLPAADVAFEIRGPEGEAVPIGFERKTLSDMLNCIEDSRFAGFQRVEMRNYYAICCLCIEGMWEPGAYPNAGWMYQAYREGPQPHVRDQWGMTRTHGASGGSKVLYSKLYRYLISLSMSPHLRILHSYDIYHTAYNICEWYAWGQKSRHTSLTEIQAVAIPEMTGLPSLTRQWAHALEGVGNLRSQQAEKVFQTPIRLANSEEVDWLRVDGIGVPTAKRIVKQIRGWK